MIAEECKYHSGRPATHNLSMDRKRAVLVCCDCYERFTAAQPCCRYCGVAVTAVDDPTPKHDRIPHLPGCPRYEVEGVADGESSQRAS